MKCNCVNEVMENLTKECGADYVIMPTELITGHVYIEVEKVYTVKGKQKRKMITVILSRCPFCGMEYEQPSNGGEG